jgi:hypothetical protein
MEKVTFVAPESGETADFFVLEQTTIGGINYLLVTETENGDADAYILKETSVGTDGETTYEMVQDDQSMEALAKVFSELLEDVDVEV